MKPVPRLNVCLAGQFFSLLAQRLSQFANITKVATLGQEKKLGKGLENGRRGVKFKILKSLASTLRRGLYSLEEDHESFSL